VSSAVSAESDVGVAQPAAKVDEEEEEEEEEEGDDEDVSKYKLDSDEEVRSDTLVICYRVQLKKVQNCSSDIYDLLFCYADNVYE